jgi:hypothetical protein
VTKGREILSATQEDEIQKRDAEINAISNRKFEGR